eukprot:TRINITY_DN4660_c0_g1_i1.p3 TRINITY_DN4660_c0_g1~~TRINITY_DN4660_c0_g1_i1.p3  ORF type:complete len:138 (+),score=10.99 TRINITY_DN4660_c0_g1_i1:64-477(+)
MMKGSFICDNMLETRKSESRKLLLSYPDRVPVVIERLTDGDVRTEFVPFLKDNKLLMPRYMGIAYVLSLVRYRLQLPPSQVLRFLFRSNTIYQGDKSLNEIYEKEKDTDGFLYIYYGGEQYAGQFCSSFVIFPCTLR